MDCVTVGPPSSVSVLLEYPSVSLSGVWCWMDEALVEVVSDAEMLPGVAFGSAKTLLVPWTAWICSLTDDGEPVWTSSSWDLVV